MKVLDIQDSQEDCVTDRADGGCKGSQQDMSAVSAHVLAPGLQGADILQRPGRADEHGGEVEAEDRLWPRRGRQSGRNWKVGGRRISECGTEIPLSY